MTRCKFYTVGRRLHTAMDAILYWYGPVHSKRPVGRGCIHTGVWKKSSKPVQNRPKFVWYGKVNQKSGRFANVPFHSRMNRKGRSSSGPLSGPAGFLQVHASAFHLRSWLLSPSILEKLSFRAVLFFIFRNKLLNFHFSEPPNSFFLKFYRRCFFAISLIINYHAFCVFGRIKKLQILFFGRLKES